MKPFETLDEMTTPEGLRLSLHRHDDDYYLILDGDELMSSRKPDSESALGRLACQRLAAEHRKGRSRPRVLIGGLGFGYTLRAVLDVLPPKAEVVVAELFPKVVEWNRQYLGVLRDHPLEDSRVRVRVGDVAELFDERHRSFFDAVLLDVDNGPTALCLQSNDRLYDRAGLSRIKQSLAPAGLLAVWSASPETGFIKVLRKSGFKVSTEVVRAFGGRGSKHTIFLARA